MPKRRKDKHHKHCSRSNEPSEYKLLTYAALGQHSKVAKLLTKHADLDINFYDAHGNTALHQVFTQGPQPHSLYLLPCWFTKSTVSTCLQASRAGHEAVVIILLRSVQSLYSSSSCTPFGSLFGCSLCCALISKDLCADRCALSDMVQMPELKMSKATPQDTLQLQKAISPCLRLCFRFVSTASLPESCKSPCSSDITSNQSCILCSVEFACTQC